MNDKIPYYQLPSDKDKKPPKLPHALYPDVVAQPTPIPLRASRKQAPEPIVLAPRPLVSPAMADFIHQELTKALYAIGRYDPEPNIATMSYEEFEAFMARVWEDA